MRQAQALRDAGKLQEAVVEFQRAASIDPTNFTAKSEANRTEEMLKKQAPRGGGSQDRLSPWTRPRRKPPVLWNCSHSRIR